MRLQERRPSRMQARMTTKIALRQNVLVDTASQGVGDYEALRTESLDNTSSPAHLREDYF